MASSWPPGWRLQTLDRTLDPAAALDEAAAEIHGLFAERERGLGVSDAVVIDYPDLNEAGPGAFLADAAGYLCCRVEALNASGPPLHRVAVLTTYSDRLQPMLTSAGYAHIPIDMPAGPEHTGVFTRIRDAGQGEGGRTLYVEAVNEADDKIRPSFALRLWDAAGRMVGGACGAVHARQGLKYAWVSTLAVQAGLPAGTGTALAEAMLDHLRAQQVHTVHLGTQTADAFYRRLGFDTLLTVVPALRDRIGADGTRVAHDLVMMEKRL